MFKYIKKYLPFALLATLFMVLEVRMDLFQPGIMKKIIDEGVLGLGENSNGNLQIIIRYGIIMIVMVLIGALCGSANNYFVHRTSQNIGNEIRKDSFAHIMSFSFSQVDKYSTGSLITRVTNDITNIQNLIAMFIRGMVRNSLQLFGSLYFIYKTNAKFGQIMIVISPLIFAVMFICLKKATPLFMKTQNELDFINAIMQEDINGIRIIKACVREEYEKNKFSKANANLLKTQLRTLTIFAFMRPAMNILIYIAVALIIISGNIQAKSGAITTGSIMSAISYTNNVLHGILMFVMISQNVSRGSASWKRIKEILNTNPEISDGKMLFEKSCENVIELKNVSFKYPNENEEILKNINLTVKKGETLAIMGSTGSGKTTLINLIMRFYDVNSGSVYINGINIKEYSLTELREKIALASQKAELFSQTIEQNIKWGNEKATLKQVKKAAETAQADEYISKKENKYNTMVAERGMSLSGGQKQRISIARTLLKNSEILIFDDATGALDLKTEDLLYKALDKEKKNITKIIIAQRVASVKNANRIAILENGTITACDSHEKLLEISETYREIVNSQLGEGIQNGR